VARSCRIGFVVGDFVVLVFWGIYREDFSRGSFVGGGSVVGLSRRSYVHSGFVVRCFNVAGL